VCSCSDACVLKETAPLAREILEGVLIQKLGELDADRVGHCTIPVDHRPDATLVHHVCNFAHSTSIQEYAGHSLALEHYLLHEVVPVLELTLVSAWSRMPSEAVCTAMTDKMDELHVAPMEAPDLTSEAVDVRLVMHLNPVSGIDWDQTCDRLLQSIERRQHGLVVFQFTSRKEDHSSE
jgi:hypothetical protein